MKAKTYINYNNCSRRATSGEKKTFGFYFYFSHNCFVDSRYCYNWNIFQTKNDIYC